MLVHVLPVDRLDELASKWDCLSRGVPFRSWIWHDQWRRGMGNRIQAFVAAVVDPTGELVGAAPLTRVHAPAYGATLRLWGDSFPGGEYRSILTTCEHEAAVADALAAWLVACVDTQEFGWSSLVLSGLSASDRVATQLAGRLGDEGSIVRREAAAPRRRVTLPNDWNAYTSTLVAEIRESLERTESHRFADGRATLRVAASLAEFDAGVEHLKRLRVQSAVELAGDVVEGSGVEHRSEQLLIDACRELFHDGRATAAWLEFSGRCVAVELRPRSADVEYCSRRACDALTNVEERDTADADFADAGSLLRWLLMRRAIEQGLTAVDLLSCDLTEAAKWNAVDRPAVHLRITAPRLTARVREGVWLAGETMKNLFRTGANLAGM